MDKSRFPATVQPTEADLNGIHDNTEAALNDLISALTGGQSYVLFDDATPTSLYNTVDRTVLTVPATRFAIDGVVGSVIETDIDLLDSVGDVQYGIFLRIERTDVSSTRTFIDTGATPPNPVTGSASFVMENGITVSIVTTQSADAVTAPPDPTPTADDVNVPLHLATVTITGTAGAPGVPPVAGINYDPDSTLWSFPGGGNPPSNHAADHLPGGSDPIQTASPAQPGIVLAQDIDTVRNALTDANAPGTSPLAVSVAGDNDSGPGIVATFDINLRSETFVVFDDSGTKRLALSFPTGPRAGSSLQAARADHVHSLDDSPIVYATGDVLINDPVTQLGSLIDFTMPESFGLVTQATVYWLPPTITAPFFPILEARWVINPSQGTIGARTIVTGSRTLKINVGGYALSQITVAERDLIVQTTGSVTWASQSGDGLLPTTGRLVIQVLGIRSGLAVGS